MTDKNRSNITRVSFGGGTFFDFFPGGVHLVLFNNDKEALILEFNSYSVEYLLLYNYSVTKFGELVMINVDKPNNRGSV